ncbi:MAG: Nudix hydrolase protein [Bacteroidetes bacterium]|nr:Nudix hydrolase protein [Bacteroidota bacterium]
MSATEENRSMNAADVELAAGGLVWSADNGKARIAIVHRPKHNDWTLPKGRPKAGEGLEDTALREAMEETGLKATLGVMAGSYGYLKNGRPKVVLLWHMTGQPGDYDKPAPKSEIDRVAWLVPDEALSRLTHESEREFVTHHCRTSGRPARTRMVTDPNIVRLNAALQSSRAHLHSLINQPGANATAWWVGSVRRSLDLAQQSLDAHDINGGWGALHDAERSMIFGMNDAELLARAATLKAETNSKLKGWRLQSTDSLFNPLKLADRLEKNGSLKKNERTLLQQVVVGALHVLNEHSDNLYHRMRLVGKQLNYLVAVCASLLVCALTISYFLSAPGSPLDLLHLGSVALAGALGGVVSAMYQLSRVGQAKIPEALLHGLITSGRPLVGAAAALFIYVVMQSNVISLIDPSKVSFETGLVLGFVAGFSEQFVLSTVAKVSGAEKQESTVGGKSVPVKNHPDESRSSVVRPSIKVTALQLGPLREEKTKSKNKRIDCLQMKRELAAVTPLSRSHHLSHHAQQPAPTRFIFLLHQHHFPGLHEVTRNEPIEIDARAKPEYVGVKGVAVRSCIHRATQQCSDLLTQQVEQPQRDQAALW